MRRRVQKLSTSYFAALHASNRRLSENVSVASPLAERARAFKGKLLCLSTFVNFGYFVRGQTALFFMPLKQRKGAQSAQRGGNAALREFSKYQLRGAHLAV